MESHYLEYQRNCEGSEMFEDEDKRAIESQYNGAQNHFEELVIQLPVYGENMDMSCFCEV